MITEFIMFRFRVGSLWGRTTGVVNICLWIWSNVGYFWEIIYSSVCVMRSLVMVM